MTLHSLRSIRSPRTLVVAGLVLLPSLALPSFTLASRRTESAVTLAHRVVLAADSVLIDPALTVGTLPNGLRYYIRVNHSPAHRAELRLVVNAGSVLEDEDQRGLAHFLEHMAFNGTTHFPRHALIDYLERAGIRFGADLNAATSFDETVYMFTVPTDSARYLEDGVQMLADWAGGGITIDSGEVLAERGVIMGEWRSRLPDTASQAGQNHRDSVLYGGDSRYLTRRPIGLTSIISHAEPGPIKRFYHDWYRPDLMAVVVVGDVDKPQVERLIRARFGTIPKAAHPRPRGRLALPSMSEPAVDVYRGQAYPEINLLWRQLPRAAASPAAFRDELVEQLLFDGLARRFLKLREQPHRPFFAAAVGRTALAPRTADVDLLRVVAWPDSLESGLATALGEMERTARYGVPAAALERQKAALLRQFESAATASAAIPSERYASDYTEHYLRGDVALLSPAQTLTLARQVLPTITPQDIANAAAFWRRRTDLQVLVTLPTFTHDRPPTRESILAVLDSVAHESLAADSAQAVAEAPLLSHLPTPGRITGEKRDPQAGITTWTLSNGARVLFKPTHFDADELLIKAVSPGGFSLVPDSLFFSSGRLVDKMMTEAAGVGSLDHDALAQHLNSTLLREFKVAITNNDESISLGGSPNDLATLFQLLYLQFTAPKLDTAALATWKQVGTNLQPSLDDQLTTLFSRGDPRRLPASPALIQFADVKKAMAVYRDRFGNASDFTFLIVGNATPQQVRPLVERYMASLPGTGKHETPTPLDVKPWGEVARQTARVFDIPKASTFLVFDGLFPETPSEYLAERQRLSALAWVLRLKLTNDLRERMAGTYSVSVQDETYADPLEHYRMQFGFDAAPENIDPMVDALLGVLDSVRTKGATSGELEKAAAIARRTHEVALQDNHYWLRVMELYDRLKIPLAEIVAPQAPLLASADVRAAAQRYLPAHAYIHFTFLPADSMIRSPGDSARQAASDSTRGAETSSLFGRVAAHP
jgi:zinc protease